MAQTTSIVDPWSGMIKGTETLRQAANAAEERKLNELRMQATKQQLAEGEMKLQQQRQAAADIQARRALEAKMGNETRTVTTPGYGGLADVQAYENAVQANKAQGNLPAMWSDTATAPIPAGGQGINIPTLSGQTAPPAAPPVMGRGLSAATPSVYEQFSQNMAGKPPYTQDQLDALNEKAIAAQQASGLSSYGEKTTQRPLSELEKAQRRAALLSSQGAYKEAGEAITTGIDVTDKIPKSSRDMQSVLLGYAQTQLAGGASPEAAKANTIKWATTQGFPPDVVQGMADIQLHPNGTAVTTLPGNQGYLISTLTKDGTYEIKHYENKRTPEDMGTFEAQALQSRALDFMKQDPTLTLQQAKYKAFTENQDRKAEIQRQNMQFKVNIGGVGGGTYRQATGLPPGYVYNSKSGQFMRLDDSTGKLRPITPEESAGLLNTAYDFQQGKSAARNAGGARSMMANAAVAQFESDAKTLVSLGQKVDRNLIASALPIIGSSTDIRKAELALRKKFNDPAAAKYFSKALATAESLGNALSGSGGATSDFKLKLARDLIDYGYDPETLQQVVDTHASSLRAKAGAMKSWGTSTQGAGVNAQPAGTRPPLSGYRD